MQHINENIIHEYDWKKLELVAIGLKKFNSSFKVLSIKNCPSFEDFESKVLKPDFCSIIKKTSHLFFISVEFSETLQLLDESTLKLRMLFEMERPFIIQLMDTGNCIIFYKDEKDEHLRVLQPIQPILKEQLIEEIKTAGNCHFELLFRAMSSKLLIEFKVNLVERKSNTDNDKILNVIIDKFQGSSLCLRFLHLHILPSKLSSSFIVSSTQSTGLGSFLAVLNLPFIENCSDEAFKSVYPNHFSDMEDLQKQNLLMQLLKLNYSQIVKYITNSSLNLNYACCSAVELEKYDVYVELIDAGAKYPPHLIEANNVNPSNCKRLKKIIEGRKKFHKSITSGDMEKVELYVNKNPNLKTVFETNNKSALTAALESRKFKVFAFLQSRGFNAEEDPNYLTVYNGLGQYDKEDINEANKVYFKYFNLFFEPHLATLLSKTQLSFEATQKEFFPVVREMYEALNAFDDIKPILVTISTYDQLKIVFDFKESSVARMEPTSSEMDNGLFDAIDAHIYVGAKDHVNNLNAVLGTLVHEMTHCAMKLVYENGCKPYRADDHENLEKFDEIYKEIKVVYEKKEFVNKNEERIKVEVDEIIERVYKHYNKNKIEAELIVRVPHLIAHYGKKAAKLDPIKNYAKGLFDFYRDTVLVDLKSYVKKEKLNQAVREVNNSDSLNSLILRKKNDFKKSLLFTLKELEDKFIVCLSNAPSMTLVAIHKTLNEKGTNCLYLNLESIAINETLHKKVTDCVELVIAPMIVNIVIDCTAGLNLYKKELNVFLTLLSAGKSKVILIVQKADYDGSFIFPEEESTRITADLREQLESTVVALCKKESKIHHLDHTSEEFEDKYLDKLLDSKVFFQKSSSVTLKELMSKDGKKLIKYLPINDLLEGRKVEVNQQKPVKLAVKPKPTFFIDRKFSFKLLRNETDEALDERNDFNLNHFPHYKNFDEKQIHQSLRINTNGIGRTENLLDSKKFYKQEKTLEETIDYGLEKRVVIISDKAGTGKSFVLIRLSEVLMKKNPTTWISYVDLKQHIEAFKAYINADVAFEEFFVLTVFKDKNNFERELFRHLHQQGRTILLLDGIDEISPNYLDMLMKVLKRFNTEFSNQLWITTRSHLENSVETILGQTSCNLLPLKESEQIEYLMNSWGSDAKNNKTFYESANTLMTKFNILKKSGSESVGAPLILYMLAIICKEQNYKFSDVDLESIDLYSIYTMFVKHLHEASERKGKHAMKDRQEVLSSRPTFWDVHEKLAIKHLYDHERLKLEVRIDGKEWKIKKLLRFGILTEKNGSMEFLHETFAEFFVAHFIYENLIKQLKSTASLPNRSLEETIRLFTETVNKEEYQVVRFFLDLASRQKMPNIFNDPKKNANFSKIFEKQLIENKSYQFLANFAKDSNENLMKFVVDIAKHFNNDVTKELLTYEHVGSKMNALQISCRSRSHCFTEMLFTLIETVESSSKNLFVQKLNYGNENIFHLAAMNNELEGVFTRLLMCINVSKLLTDAEVKTMLQQNADNQFNLFHYFARYNNEKALKENFTTLNKHLTEGELKSLLISKNIHQHNCLHEATRRNSQTFVQDLYNIVESFLNDGEFKELIKARDVKLQNILHLAAMNKRNEGVFDTLLDCVIKKLSGDEILTLLRQKDKQHSNVFYLMKNGSEK